MPGPIVSRPLLKKLVVAALATLTVSGTLIFGNSARIQGSIIPSANNTYSAGSSSLRWLNGFFTNVSSSAITVQGTVSSTKLVVDGGNGKYVSLDPANSIVTYAAYASPSTITYFPFSDGNNYMRGTTTYVTGELRQEAGVGNSAWQITAAGAVSSTSLRVGGYLGTINKYAEGSASLDFGATAAGTCDSLTVTVTGAADGDAAVCGIPNALSASDTYQSFQCFVSAANTVTVKRCNLTNAVTALSNPAAATVKAHVID